MKDAEEVLHQFPLKMKGTMLPTGMKFFTNRKLLSDPKFNRARPFLGACKVWGTVGHKAFECEEQFQFEAGRQWATGRVSRWGSATRTGATNEGGRCVGYM